MQEGDGKTKCRQHNFSSPEILHGRCCAEEVPDDDGGSQKRKKKDVNLSFRGKKGFCSCMLSSDVAKVGGGRSDGCLIERAKIAAKKSVGVVAILLAK